MTEHRVGTPEEWLAARKELLEREDEVNRLTNELAELRRELPWVPVEKEYSFETDEGQKTLAELFDLTDEQMAEDEFRKLVEEPLDWLEDWARQVGTDLPTGLREGPGWIAFALEDGVVYHTHSRRAPDGDLLAPYYYQLLDQVPKGRGDGFRAVRHDEYEGAKAFS